MIGTARWLRCLFFLLVVRPFILVVIGLNVRGRASLPRTGPAILVANHNSHLDVFVLATLFPQALIPRFRPVAAADYFLERGGLRAWFAREIVGIVPVKRMGNGGKVDPLAGAAEALEAGAVLVLFPEGSRGEPEQRQAFKTGVAHLAKRFPDVPVVPVWMHGLGKALPRGTSLLVPFFCDVWVGAPVAWDGERNRFMAALESRFRDLEAEAAPRAWL